jgi:uncharacterized OsmC-like protein
MSEATSNQQDKITNGVNITQLFDTIGAVKENPEIAKFQFRATNQWIKGGHNRTTIKEFYGACAEDTTRKESFVLDADEPPILLGEDTGPNPVEYVLKALASCMTTTMVYHAASRGIVIEEVESTLEGDLDLQGFLGIKKEVRKGFQNIKVSFKVKSDGDTKLLEQLAKNSPVFDIVTNPVPVSVTVKKK